MYGYDKAQSEAVISLVQMRYKSYVLYLTQTP